MSKSSPAEWVILGGLASGCFVGSEADSVADVHDTAADCYGLQCPCEPGFDCEIDPYYAPDALCFTDAEVAVQPGAYPKELFPQPDGTIAWETDDHIYEWRGDVQGATWPGQTAQVIEAWDGFTGFEGSYDGGWVTSEYPDPEWGHEYGAVTFGAKEPWWRFRPEDTGIYLSRITWGNVAGGEATDFIVTEERDTGLSYHENFVYVFADPGPGQVTERDATAVILTHEYQVVLPLVVGDLDGDGGDEIVSVYVPYGVFFSPVEGARNADEPDAILNLSLVAGNYAQLSSAQAPFDVDGDGRDELLALGAVSSVDAETASALQVYSWDSSGLVARGSVVASAGIQGGSTSPVATDLDGDGVPDFVVPVTDGALDYLTVLPYSEGVQELSLSGYRAVQLPDDLLSLSSRPVPLMYLGDDFSGLLVRGANVLCGEAAPAYSVIDFASMLGVGL